MADVHDKNTRSYNMSCIKNKNTKPEILVRKFIFSKGFRFRIHYKKLPGKPDIVFPRLKTVLFVHGCFWHGHENCQYFAVPKTRTEWWQKKISRNKELDKQNLKKLRDNGWKVLAIFECQLKSSRRSFTLNRIIKELKKVSDFSK